MGGKPAQLFAKIKIFNVGRGGLEQRKCRAQPPHRHATLVERSRVTTLDYESFVQSIVLEAGVDDHLECIGYRHRANDFDRGGLADAVERSGSEQETTLGLAEDANPDGQAIGDHLGGADKARRFTVQKLQFEFIELLVPLSSGDLTFVEIDPYPALGVVD